MSHLYLFLIYFFYTLLFFPFSTIILLLYFLCGKITKTNFIQKLGFIPLTNPNQIEYFHVHLCSIGEWNTFFTFLSELKRSQKNQVLVTYFNQDLSSTILKSKLIDKCFFLPLENPLALFLMYRIYRIRYSIISEAESWPGLLFLARFLKKKVFLVNAQMFLKEFQRYRNLFFFFRPLFNCYFRIYPSSSQFSERFKQLGVNPEKIILGGNFKFDTDYQKFKKKLFFIPTKKKVIILASFHHQEFLAVLPVLTFLFQQNSYSFIFVPRSLLEKGKWQKTLNSLGINYMLRSQKKAIDLNNHLLLDSYGEMFSLYSRVTVVIMGGSFIPLGGHNLLEALWNNKPVIIGPYTFHFSDIVKVFQHELFFSDSQKLGQDLPRILQRLEKTKKINYLPKLKKNQGHSKKILQSILALTSSK